jgi:hypothetical protein
MAKRGRPPLLVNVRLLTGRVTGRVNKYGFPRHTVNEAGDVVALPRQEAMGLVDRGSAELIETATRAPARHAAKRIGKPS